MRRNFALVITDLNKNTCHIVNEIPQPYWIFLKGVLESYEHELTFSGAAFEKDRITAMEASLKDYKDTVERLEELLSSAR